MALRGYIKKPEDLDVNQNDGYLEVNQNDEYLEVNQNFEDLETLNGHDYTVIELQPIYIQTSKNFHTFNM